MLNQIADGFIKGNKIYDRKNDFVYDSFRIDMMLGISKKRNFRTAWSIDKKGGKPRFVTAFRYEEKNK